MTKRLPAEWEKQSAILIIWPHADTDWRPTLSKVEETYIEISLEILKRQKLIICFHNQNIKQHALTALNTNKANTSNLISFIAENNDTWARDSGPITILDNSILTLLDFTFNGWGDKYSSSLDDQITAKMLHSININNHNYKSIDMILEGGSIESDGQGTLLTTSKCLLTDTRNSDMTKDQVEQRLIAEFNLERILWLNHGFIIGDDTDSHIDTLARFCSEDTIAYCTCNDESDSHYTELRNMESELKQLKTKNDTPYKLIPLPIPKAQFSTESGTNKTRLPATYANFLIINGAVLAPIYGDSQADTFAIKQLQTAFPKHEIIAINCCSLIEQFGSLHCITMQLPESVQLTERVQLAESVKFDEGAI